MLPRPFRRTGFALAVLLASFAPTPDAQACSTCACGDPTLTVMGAEQPFAGRTRFSLDLRYHSDGSTAADPAQQHMQSELKLSLGVSHAATPWLVFSASVPYLLRDVYAPLGDTRSHGLGGAELRARAIVFRDRGFQPRHLIGVTAGAGLPLGGGGGHDPYRGGGWDTQLALSYSYFSGGLFSGYTSVTGVLPMGAPSFGSGRALNLTLMGQAQLTPKFAVRLGSDARFQAPLVTHGQLDPHSGSSVAFASGELLFSPLTNLVLIGAVRAPVLASLQPDRWEGPFANVSAVFDL